MHILTRAEEEVLFKTLKANALKECDPVVKGTTHQQNKSMELPICLFLIFLHYKRNGLLTFWIDLGNQPIFFGLVIEFVECTHGKLVTVLWGCRAQHKAMNKCLMAL